MALKQILFNKSTGPYSRLPLLHIHIISETTQQRVINWDFSDNSATPKTIKTNKIVTISDGNSVSKLTLFEEFSSRVSAGKNYIMKGYALRGTTPPFTILCHRGTLFYRAAPVPVADHLRQEAASLLEPPSVPTRLDSTGAMGLLTLEGEITEVCLTCSLTDMIHEWQMHPRCNDRVCKTDRWFHFVVQISALEKIGRNEEVPMRQIKMRQVWRDNRKIKDTWVHVENRICLLKLCVSWLWICTL